MNEPLAKQVAEMIIEKWDPETHDHDSGDLYAALIAKSVEVPENDMNEILAS